MLTPMFRFGNGLFACMILALTLTDLMASLVGIMGSLVIEVGGMAWLSGDSQGCAVYYFTSSWLVSLSNYLVTCLSLPASVSRHRLLLMILLLMSVLPALPELGVREVISSGSESICIFSTDNVIYCLYFASKMIARHIIPITILFFCLIKSNTTSRDSKTMPVLLIGCKCSGKHSCAFCSSDR